MPVELRQFAHNVAEPAISKIIDAQIKRPAYRKVQKLDRLQEEMADLKAEIIKHRRLLKELEIKRINTTGPKSKLMRILFCPVCKYQKEKTELHQKLAKYIRRYAYLFRTRVPQVHDEMCHLLMEQRLVEFIPSLPMMETFTIGLDDSNCGIDKDKLDSLLQEPRSKFHQKCTYNIALRHTIGRFSFGSIFKDPDLPNGINSTEAVLFEQFYDALNLPSIH